MATGLAAGGRLQNPNVGAPIGPSTPPTTPYGSPAAYSAAVNTQGGDYDSIMKNYEDLLKSNTNAASRPYTPITPQLSTYKPSDDVTKSLSNLSGLASTGGYSGADIADIRARDISPIRSIYASAQSGLDRSKALQGGYSPNYAATTAKLARSLSDQIGQKTTDVNATIAQNVAQNKLSIAPSYASAAQSENSARTAIDQKNSDMINQINELNAQMSQQYNQTNNDNILKDIEGKRALYGTNPALINTFGGQVANAAQLSQGQQQINNNKTANNFGLARSVLG